MISDASQIAIIALLALIAGAVVLMVIGLFRGVPIHARMVYDKDPRALSLDIGEDQPPESEQPPETQHGS